MRKLNAPNATDVAEDEDTEADEWVIVLNRNVIELNMKMLYFIWYWIKFYIFPEHMFTYAMFYRMFTK